ncbi:neuropilin-1-like [Haliotis cracherodii]|uniref:neuropilin-1-like n=1 Tax=Haliotis cracherodii TaxID=6455 RepID=UPI0039ECE630
MAIGGYLGICLCLAVIAVSKGANLDCDFETNFCQWTHGSSVRQWKRHLLATLTPGTGPDTGHTTQGREDYYIYLHAGERTVENGLIESGKCVLLSPAFNTTSSGGCFRFWYHMKGLGIGNLSAAVVEGSSSVSEWSKTGQQGADWKCAHFPLEQGKEDLQIEMTAWTGVNPVGDIALDDFKFFESNCNGITDVCGNITATPSSTPPTQSSTPDEQSSNSTTEGVVTTTPAEDDITMTIVYISIAPVALLIIVSVVAFVRYKCAKSNPIENNNFIWPNNNNPTEPDIDNYDNLQDVYAELDESKMDKDGRVISSSTNEGHTPQLSSTTGNHYEQMHRRHPASSSRTEMSNGITGPYMTMETRDEDDLPGDGDYLVSIPGPNELQTGSGKGDEEDVAKAPGKEEDSSEASYHNGHGDLAEDGKKLPPVQCGRTASYISPVFENI